MMRFLSDSLWPTIKNVAADPGRKWMAVPYVASGAAKRLPLKKDDVLVLRFDDGTLKTGATDPREVLKFLKRGVQVHAHATLHAKVYVSSRRTVVASANLSGTSEDRLEEAGVVSREAAFIRKAKGFVLSLCGEAIGPEYAKSKLKIYRPPRSGGGGGWKKVKERSGQRMWVVGLSLKGRTEVAKSAAKRAVAIAERRVANAKAFSVDDFQFDRRLPVRRGDWVVQYIKDGRRAWFEAPVRVLHIERYRESRYLAQIVGFEERKWLHDREPADLVGRLRKSGLKFRRPAHFYEVRSLTLRRALLTEWKGVTDK